MTGTAFGSKYISPVDDAAGSSADIAGNTAGTAGYTVGVIDCTESYIW